MICKKALGKPTLFKDEMIDASLTVNGICVIKLPKDKLSHPYVRGASRRDGMFFYLEVLCLF
jgi:hypothetical protein